MKTLYIITFAIYLIIFIRSLAKGNKINILYYVTWFTPILNTIALVGAVCIKIAELVKEGKE